MYETRLDEEEPLEVTTPLGNIYPSTTHIFVTFESIKPIIMKILCSNAGLHCVFYVILF